MGYDFIQEGLKAVTYARVSGDDRGKDGRNLGSQLDMAREYAHRKGYEIIAELAEDDRGASGASFELEQLGKVQEMAAGHEFDVLVVREIDRLSRNLAKQLIVEEALRRHGVRVEYVLGEYPDTPEGNLMKNIRATIAEFERLKITERNTRGRYLKVKAGNVMTHGGKAPFGYRCVSKDGKETFEIYELEARIVRLIYQWYTQGDGEAGPMTFGGIARRLTELGLPSAQDFPDRHWGAPKKRGYGEWGRAMVQKILKNSTYIGRWEYGKKARKNGKWIIHPKENRVVVKVPAIVDLNTWHEAERRRARNKLESKRNSKNYYLLSRRVICGVCGHKMTGVTVKPGGKSHPYYRCGGRRGQIDTTVQCTAPLVMAQVLDACIWERVKAFLSDPVALEEGLQDYQNERDKENAPLRERLKVVDDLLADNRAQLGRLLDLYLERGFPKEILLDRKKRLETTIQSLEKERSSLVSSIDRNALTSDQVQTIKEFATKVAKGLERAEESFEVRREIIEALDVEVTVTVEQDKQMVYLRWISGAEVATLFTQGIENTTISNYTG
jgi:site-specific DNA recombinase